MTEAPGTIGDRRTLSFERHFAHGQHKVWQALTDPHHLSQWYPMTATEIDLRLGGTIRFRDEEGTMSSAEITELEPQEVFAFREYEESTGTHDLRFTLVPDESGGCQLTFTHTFSDNPWAEQTEAGWIRCLEALISTLSEIEPS